MIVVGIRCSSSDYCFVVLEGTKNEFQILDRNIVKFPAGYPRAHSLKWLYQELIDLLSQYEPEKVIMKDTEPGARKNSAFIKRIENEAIVYLASIQSGLKHSNILKKAKRRIAKDLGFKGKSKYIQDVDWTMLEEFDLLKTKEQEATLAARSELKNG